MNKLLAKKSHAWSDLCSVLVSTAVSHWIVLKPAVGQSPHGSSCDPALHRIHCSCPQRHVSAQYRGIRYVVPSCWVGDNTSLHTISRRSTTPQTNKHIKHCQHREKRERHINMFWLIQNRSFSLFTVLGGHCGWRFINTKPSSFCAARVLFSHWKKQNWAVTVKVQLHWRHFQFLIPFLYPSTVAKVYFHLLGLETVNSSRVCIFLSRTLFILVLVRPNHISNKAGWFKGLWETQ